MCLATPAKVIEIDGEMAVVEIEGIRRRGNISLLDNVAVGDFVLVHAGFAIQHWTAEEMKDLIVLPLRRPDRFGGEG